MIENVKRTGKAVTPKGGDAMTDYEILMVNLTILGIVTTLIVAYIKK